MCVDRVLTQRHSTRTTFPPIWYLPTEEFAWQVQGLYLQCMWRISFWAWSHREWFETWVNILLCSTVWSLDFLTMSCVSRHTCNNSIIVCFVSHWIFGSFVTYTAKLFVLGKGPIHKWHVVCRMIIDAWTCYFQPSHNALQSDSSLLSDALLCKLILQASEPPAVWHHISGPGWYGPLSCLLCLVLASDRWIFCYLVRFTT